MNLKLSALVLATAGAFASTAFASGTQIYGVIDQDLDYQHVNRGSRGRTDGRQYADGLSACESGYRSLHHTPHTELRRALVPKWNALRDIRSKLDPNQLNAPLEFLDDVEPGNFIDFAEDEIRAYRFPDPSPDTKSEFQNLIGQLIDDLNGQPWVSNMAMGYAYNFGLRRDSISFFESASYMSGCWVIDYQAVAEQVIDYPKYRGHTVSEWARLDEGPWIRSDRITAKYTF